MTIRGSIGFAHLLLRLPLTPGFGKLISHLSFVFELRFYFGVINFLALLIAVQIFPLTSVLCLSNDKCAFSKSAFIETVFLVPVDEFIDP